MATLNKLLSGNLYEDSFDTINLLWDIYPNNNNRVVKQIYGVGILHGDERVTMSIPTPAKDYVFQVELEHLPNTLSDVGGVIVLSTTDNQIECQTYYNTGAGLNQYYKHIKVCAEGDVYTFYASKDASKWELIGNASLPDANRIGFFLDGPSTAMAQILKIKNVSIYKSNILTINNVSTGHKLSITDLSGKELIDTNKVSLSYEAHKLFVDLTNLKLPLKDVTLTLYDNENNIIVEAKDIDIYGGDVYDCVILVDFYMYDTLITPTEVFDVGRLQIKDNIYPLKIVNKDLNNLAGAKVGVLAYSEYYRGERSVTVAVKPTDGSEPKFAKQVSLPVIPPGGWLDLLIKIERDPDDVGPFFAQKYRFKVVLE